MSRPDPAPTRHGAATGTTASRPEELPGEIAAERRELAELLAGLSPEAWEQPSLCSGWRVREVVAHMTMPFRYSTARFALEMARSRANFTRMADRCARRDATASPAELTAALRDNAEHPWRPPGGGLTGALTHDVIHGLDITVALGIDRTVPASRMAMVLDGITAARSLKFFGTDLTGVSLRADDIDWSAGSGTLVTGAAQDLALAVCGRRLPPGRLHGADSLAGGRSPAR
jgi:uncharacterized protein (TIGR03083 family)